MKTQLTPLFRFIPLSGDEQCTYVETEQSLSLEQFERLQWVFGTHAEPHLFGQQSFLEAKEVVEIGPRESMATPFSTNAVSFCRDIGIPAVRIEQSTRYVTKNFLGGKEEILDLHFDVMTQEVYSSTLEAFSVTGQQEPLFEVPMLEEGVQAIMKVSAQRKLGLDLSGCEHILRCALLANRNYNQVEVGTFATLLSDHSLHTTWKSERSIDGTKLPETLMQMAKSTLYGAPNSKKSFNDGSGVQQGYEVELLLPINADRSSAYVESVMTVHFTVTAETHNHPSMISPYQGAHTCTDGLSRDGDTTGEGSIWGGFLNGCVTANYYIPGYQMPGENPQLHVEDLGFASPLSIRIEGTNGQSDSANQLGVPCLGGYNRTVDIVLPDGERVAAFKPTIYGAHVGTIFDQHLSKGVVEEGMLIIRFGGPAYKVGIGGGPASSGIQGGAAGIDFASVQRGNGEMGHKANRVISACVYSKIRNLLNRLQDQGAGGITSLFAEMLEHVGGYIDLAMLSQGDPTMTLDELLRAEFQESFGALIFKSDLPFLQTVCAREKVPLDVLGETTGDRHFVVYDSRGGQRLTVVDIDLAAALSNVPAKKWDIKRKERKLVPFVKPEVTFREVVERVLQLQSVGSKADLVHMIDRSVGGNVVLQPCCGPLQVPIADCGILAVSPFSFVGQAVALGERPMEMLVNAAAGARMSLAEGILNLLAADFNEIAEVEIRANWQWAAKLDGEGAFLHDANQALVGMLKDLRIQESGGKDSSSLAARIKRDLIKSAGQLVVCIHAAMRNVNVFLTPDIKLPGSSMLGYLDLFDKCRLGGSAYAQAFDQVGDECPDVDDVKKFNRYVGAIKEMHRKGLILSYHDKIGDGGLFTALTEMAIGGNCGLTVSLKPSIEGIDAQLFNQEVGAVIEYTYDQVDKIRACLAEFGLSECFIPIGKTATRQVVKILEGERLVLMEETKTLRSMWEATSTALEKIRIQMKGGDIELPRAEQWANQQMVSPVYNHAFTRGEIFNIQRGVRPKVAILRSEGSNGDADMRHAFFAGGFDPYDVHMEDLLHGDADLSRFNAFAAVGGFSNMDVPTTARGWAATIKFNERLAEMFALFLGRSDTCSYSACNGDQLATLLDIVPQLGLPDERAIRLEHNRSMKFESRWSTVIVPKSPSVAFTGMEGSVLGIHSDHGEGKYTFADPEVLDLVEHEHLVALRFATPLGYATEQYPWNPNGSPHGIAGFTSRNGRHTATMPHVERTYLLRQWHYCPAELWEQWKESPWLQVFRNLRNFCDQA